MLDDAAAFVDRIWRDGLRPDPDLTVSDWADANRFLSNVASAEPGRWRTSRTPYLREIMDALSASSPIERVVFAKAAQIGGTEAGNNWIGYVIAQAPGPMLAVSPTTEMAKRASKQRIDPLIEESPTVREKVSPARSRDAGNTVTVKEFPGGVLVMTGANSAVGLRSMPVRNLFLDEIDAYPQDADNEGDPVDLAVKRSATFARRKILEVSTPTVAGVSRIEAAYEESDKRRYFVPCPDCGEFQTLEWANVRWSDIGRPPAEAAYCCASCGVVIEHHRKPEMLARGEWRPTAESTTPRIRGFHLSALYSPWMSWGEAAEEFVKARGNPNRMKVFTNTVLGEAWQDSGEAPDWERLYERRADYPIGIVPEGGLYLTAGCDVQADRLELEIVAWGRGMESWSIDYRVLEGSPHEAGVWSQLDAILSRQFDHALGGRLAIGKLAIDTGYATQRVYKWAGRHRNIRILPIKGVDTARFTLGAPTAVEITEHGHKRKAGVRLWPVGVGILKGQVYGWLNAPLEIEGERPEGYAHFPMYGPEYFKQLTAERLVTRRNKAGFAQRAWEQTRPRNEALDCRVYALAAALAARLDSWTETEWADAEATLREAPKREAAPAVIRSPWIDGA